MHLYPLWHNSSYYLPHPNQAHFSSRRVRKGTEGMCKQLSMWRQTSISGRSRKRKSFVPFLDVCVCDHHATSLLNTTSKLDINISVIYQVSNYGRHLLNSHEQFHLTLPAQTHWYLHPTHLSALSRSGIAHWLDLGIFTICYV